MQGYKTSSCFYNMNNNKIVTLILSATEIVAFLGHKKSIIGKSMNVIIFSYTLTSPKINYDGTSK